MRLPTMIALLCASTASPAQAPRFDPAAEYVTAGQDEAGYRAWATGEWIRWCGPTWALTLDFVWPWRASWEWKQPEPFYEIA